MSEPGNPASGRVRTVSWDDPHLIVAASRGQSGLDFLRAIAAGRVPAPPIARLLGMSLEEVDEGRAVFTVEPAEYHYNPIGVVHGGLAATLLDSAMGCAVHSLLPAGAGYTTAEIKVNYVRALRHGIGRVRAVGTVVHRGRKLTTAEGRVVDADGKLYAHGSTTCLILGEP